MVELSMMPHTKKGGRALPKTSQPMSGGVVSNRGIYADDRKFLGRLIEEILGLNDGEISISLGCSTSSRVKSTADS